LYIFRNSAIDTIRKKNQTCKSNWWQKLNKAINAKQIPNTIRFIARQVEDRAASTIGTANRSLLCRKQRQTTYRGVQERNRKSSLTRITGPGHPRNLMLVRENIFPKIKEELQRNNIAYPEIN
jgi:hypothetical protein